MSSTLANGARRRQVREILRKESVSSVCGSSAHAAISSSHRTAAQYRPTFGPQWWPRCRLSEFIATERSRMV